MSEVPATIFVVDDDPSVRKSLGRLLRSAGYQTEVFASAREFLQRKPPVGAGCAVLDVRMPDLNGLELQQASAAAGDFLPIIFLTGHGDIPMSVQAMKAGAVDFLPKPCPDADLLQAIKDGLAKEGQERKERSEIAEIKRRLATLTPREYEVLCHVVTGELNKQTAGDLGVVEKTVKVHRRKVMEKMQARSLAELVPMTTRAGLTAAGEF